MPFTLFTIAFPLFYSAMVFSQTVCEDGLQAFSKTIHPLLQQHCTQCHGDSGMAVNHSASDPRVAYPKARKFADFSDIQRSRFYRRVSSAHWLEYDENARGMTVSEMDEALKAWWQAGENLCPTTYKVEVSALPFPQPMPDRKSGKYAPVTWDLGLTSPTLKGCEAAVDIQLFSNGTGGVPSSYRLKSPRLKCPSGEMKVDRVRFFINGSTQSFENVYEDISTSLKHDGNYHELSQDLMIVVPRPEPKNSISVSFGELSLSQRIPTGK